MTVPLEDGWRLKVAFWIKEIAAGAVTVKPAMSVPLWPSGLVTVTLRVPTAAVGLMLILTVS